MSHPSYITFRKHTFLSSVAMGLSAVVITLLISCTVVGLYTVHLASQKSERVLSLAQGAIRGLPEFTKSLPPALADMLDDRRDPQYCSELAISARVISEPGPHGKVRTAVEIVNNGDAVISLLSLRITILDDTEQLLCESQEWAATPLAADRDWRGPIMPGSKRRFVSHAGCLRGIDPMDALNAQVEVTELRVWNDPKAKPAPAAGPTAETASAIALAEPDNG
jgi:hypothetical protein